MLTNSYFSNIFHPPINRLHNSHVEEEREREFEEQIAVRVYTGTIENDPDIETDVQEFEEVLDDGTVVKKRITKTKQKQTIIKRVVMEGPEDELPVNEEEAQELLKKVR